MPPGPFIPEGDLLPEIICISGIPVDKGLKIFTHSTRNYSYKHINDSSYEKVFIIFSSRKF
jgi:hypothetical protein